MTFGENLKTLRNARSLSQKELAASLGFSFQNISKWERGAALPDIATLLQIAVFFNTTTDALLGHIPEGTFSNLRIAGDEVQVWDAYPGQAEDVTGKLLLAVDREGRIAAITFVPQHRMYRDGYTRAGYDPVEEKSTLLYACRYRMMRQDIDEFRRIRIPEGGYLLVLSDADYATKKLLQFVIPREHHGFLDPGTHQGYHNGRNGTFLFCDILKRNELDHITVERTGEGILFKKPMGAIDPLSVNIETLSKIVRRELEKEHDRQLSALRDQIDALSDTTDDNEARIDALEDQIEALEGRIGQLEAQIRESACGEVSHGPGEKIED